MKFGIRELIFVCVMLGLLGATWFLFDKANVRRTEKLADMETKRKALVNLTQSTAGIEDLNNKIDELQQAIGFFESKLPQEKEIHKILNEISQMGDTNSLQTKTVKTLKIEKSANYNEQPIQVSLSGDFNGFYAFLLQLEKLPRITRVTKMDLQKINGRDGEMQANITLSIFYEPEGRVVASAK